MGRSRSGSTAIARRQDAHLIDQCKALTQCDASCPRWRTSIECAALDAEATGRRIPGILPTREGAQGKAGFPRFRGAGRWEAFGFAEFSGIRFDGKRLRLRRHAGRSQSCICIVLCLIRLIFARAYFAVTVTAGMSVLADCRGCGRKACRGIGRSALILASRYSPIAAITS